MKLVQFVKAVTCACALLAATGACAGERWRYLESQEQRAIQAGGFMLGADGSLWTLEVDGVRRFDAAGRLIGAFPTVPGIVAFDTRGVPLADNGAVVRTAGANGDCMIARLDASLRARWSHDGALCDSVSTPGGTVWAVLGRDDLVRLGQDGSVAARTRVSPYPAALAAMQDDGVAVGSLVYDGSGGSVSRYGRDGALRWSFSRDKAGFTQLARGADDSLAAAGIVDTVGTQRGFVFYRLAADGTLRSEYRGQDPEEFPMHLVLAGDGAASLLVMQRVGGNTRYLLYRFDPDGRFVWRTEACELTDTLKPSLVLLPGGGAVAACPNLDGAKLVRFDANGLKVASMPLPMNGAMLALRADGNLQLLGDGKLEVRDIDGNPVDAPMPQAGESLRLADQRLDADGTSWLLSVSARAEGARTAYLSKVNANGTPAWRRTLPAVAPNARLSIAGGQACVTMAYTWTPPPLWGPPQRIRAPGSITCYAAADGAERWTRSFPADTAAHHFGALDDGTFIHVRSADASALHTIVRHDASGNEIASIPGDGFARAAMIEASTGAVVVLDDTSSRRRIIRYDAQHNASELVAATADALEIVEVAADAALVRATTANDDSSKTVELRSYAPDGRLVWKRMLRDPAQAVTATRAGAAIYLVESLVTAGASYQTRVTRLDARSGAPAWEYLSNARPEEFSPLPLAFAVSDDRAALARTSRNRLRVLHLDARDGAPSGEESVACNGYCGQATALALDADGTARVALPLASPARGATAAVVALGDTLGSSAVRLDQPGLAGAWWAPYANGEGFVIDWLPSSRTWFMPWFTFSRAGGSERDEQRWYTVGGTPAIGATQAELPIMLPTGGTFDASGGVTSRQVGTAMLRFTDCDNGTFQYVFDAGENRGATGTITLSRLTPATQDCVLADGAVQTRAAAPANGFDARMSGSWLEEATAGQGFEFAVQPDGLFFATWFTFDPAGTTEPRDPGRQRWYTLQGSLANARNGRVELVIVQALGGTLDSVPANNQFVVGAVTLTLTACDRATLEYRFADDDLAADLRGVKGTIDLVKSGGCVP